MTVREELLTPALLDELGPLAEGHAAEVVEQRPQLDRASYLALAAAGGYRTWVAREAAGRVAGYCGMLMLPDLRLGVLSAAQDALYVLPAARPAGHGLELLRASDRDLLASGVAIVYRTAPCGRALDRVLERLGYRPTEVVFARRLG